MTLESTIVEMGKSAKAASRVMARCSAQQKNDALVRIADSIESDADRIIEENQKDIRYGLESGLSSAMIDRLTIKDATIRSMAAGLREVALMEDPVGAVTKTWRRPNGLEVSRMRIPLGVIGIIYESRPNVTIDAAGLCFKAGNAVILRGGSEAFHSNQSLAAIVTDAMQKTGLPPKAVQVVPVRDRDAVTILLKQEETIDLIIPRGGEGLIRFVVEHSKIPVLKHYKGVCHVYVDDSADIEMAKSICFNAKVQRPGVCNAMETMLVHQAIAPSFLPEIARLLIDSRVELRGCPETIRLIPDIKAATEEDWGTEYVDLILSVKIVNSMEEAVAHIEKYGSNHTDTIVTSDYRRARRFVREVDSSVVLVNASTRFNDGGQLGLGAEIGISTTKLHAFGPMSVEELTTTKFVVFGDGQIRTS